MLAEKNSKAVWSEIFVILCFASAALDKCNFQRATDQIAWKVTKTGTSFFRHEAFTNSQCKNALLTRKTWLIVSSLFTVQDYKMTRMGKTDEKNSEHSLFVTQSSKDASGSADWNLQKRATFAQSLTDCSFGATGHFVLYTTVLIQSIKLSMHGQSQWKFHLERNATDYRVTSLLCYSRFKSRNRTCALYTMKHINYMMLLPTPFWRNCSRERWASQLLCKFCSTIPCSSMA